LSYEACLYPECTVDNEVEDCDCDPDRHLNVMVFARLGQRDVLIMAMDVFESAVKSHLCMLGTAPYFEPAALRSSVYQEILLAYFKYMGENGRRLVTWSVIPPPSKALCYLFRHLPSDLTFLEADVLRLWYKKLCSKAVARGIASGVNETVDIEVCNVELELVSSVPCENGPVDFEAIVRLSEFEMKEFFINENLSFSNVRRAVYATRALVKFIVSSM
jgi:hypothetical protein